LDTLFFGVKRRSAAYAHPMRFTPGPFDAVIVGGGPAGSTTAIELAKQGWDILLLERGGRYRDKTCGHCLNPRAIDMLGCIGLRDLEGENAPPATSRFRMHSADGRSSTVELDRPGRLVERHRFDQLLRDTAASHGIEVRHETSAIGFDFDGDGASVRVRSQNVIHNVRTGLVVGADGLGSAVARASGLTDGGRQGRKLGFSFDWRSPRAGLLDAEAIHMYLDSDGGYLGVVRHADHTIHMAGLIQPKRGSSDSAQARHPVEWVRSLAKRRHELRDLSLDDCDHQTMLRFCAAGPMPWRTSAVAGSRIALVGDAAGYVEPFTGEGMTWAIHSALTLSSCLRDVSPGSWSTALADRYQRAWQAAIGSRQRVCRGLALALERPRVARFMIRVGDRFPRLTGAIVRQVVKS